MTNGKKTMIPILVVLALVSFAGSAWAQQDRPTPAQLHSLITEMSDVFESAANTVSDFVVPIYAEQVVRTSAQSSEDPFREFFGNDFFKRFFGVPSQPQTRTVRSLGSGVIVSPDGHILTNNHVVAGANKLTVFLRGKRRLPAKVIGTDPLTDIAVIKIEAEGLPTAVLGDSDKVKVGEWVIAVGNPFALLRTVTHGIISATGRSSIGISTYEDFIQTDAPINPGNSGGALADLDGHVVGINSAISSPSGGNVGLGFAIPINLARSIMDQLIAHGRVIRGFLGVTAQDIDPSLVGPLKLKNDNGALVSEVNPDTPAARAGLKTGDDIVEFNGKPVNSSRDLSSLAAETAPGTRVKIVLVRDGETLEVTATMAERPEAAGQAKPAKPGEGRGPTAEKLGLAVQTLTSDIAQQLGYAGEKGVLITEVTPGGSADDSDLKAGDLIKEVNRVPVTSAQEFATVVRAAKSGQVLALLVQRGAQSFFVAVKVP
jgi:serine protease Do